MASLEDLFERWRSRGDLAALGAVFDRTAPALLRIATHLCGNAADAEDAVQATFVRAIEAAADWDASRPLTPWLVGILGNRARHGRVREARRPDPLRLPARADDADPVRTAQRRELGDAVAATIGVLPARYRPVLRLHLVDGRDPAEIAAQLELRPGTVRSQLARGLRALRRLLPPGFAAGAAKAQLAACLPRVRAAVLAAGAHGAGATAAVAAATAAVAASASASASAFVVGGLAMQKVALCSVVAALVVLLLVWNVLPPDPQPGAPRASSAAAAATADAARPDTPPGAATAGGAPPGERVEVPRADEARADPPATDRAALRVRVAWRTGGEPAAGVAVFVEPHRGGLRTPGQWQRTTGADGTAIFDDLPPRPVRVGTGRTQYRVRDNADGTVVALAAGAVTEHALWLDGVTVAGVVVDADGRPVAGARVVVAADDVRELAQTAADGTFAVRGLGPEVRLAARAAGHAPSPLHAIPPPRDGRVGELRIVLPDAGGRLVATVVDADGAPVPDAQVSVGAGHWHENGDAAAWIETTDAGGVATFDGVPLGDLDVFAWAEHRAPWRGTVVIRAAEPALATIELPPGAVLHGQVRDANGNPLARRQVAVGRAGSEAHRAFGRFAWQFATSGEDGAYRLDGLPAGRIDAVVDGAAGAAAAARTFTMAAGETVRWDPELAPGRGVSGRILGPDGRGLAATIDASSRDRRSWYGYAFSDADGRFAVQGIEPGQHLRLVASLDVFPIARFEGAVPHDGEIVLRVAAAAMPSARIAGIVADDQGAALPLAEVTVVQRGHGSSPQYQAGDGGRFDVGTFPPGEYCLFVAAAGRARTRTEWFVLAPGEAKDVGTIRLDPAGTVAVQLHGDVALRGPLYLPVLGGRTASRHVEIRDGHGELADLEAGHYVLLVMTRGLALARHEFDVAAGGCTRLDLTVAAGVPATFTLRHGDRPLPKLVAFELTADGRVLLDTQGTVLRDGRVDTQPFGLQPGAYAVRVRDQETRALLGERTFAVQPGAATCAVEVPFAGR